jgi:hypothetical protein
MYRISISLDANFALFSSQKVILYYFYFAFNQLSACIATCFIPSGVKVHTPSLLVIHPYALAYSSDVLVLPALEKSVVRSVNMLF